MSTSQPDESSVGISAVRVVAALALLAGAFIILRPFLVATIWAGILAFVSWPLFDRARRISGRPGLTALAFTLFTLVILGVPAIWLLVGLAQQATSFVATFSEWLRAGAVLPEWLVAVPQIGPRIEELRASALQGDTPLDVVSVGSTVSQYLALAAGGIAGNAFSFAIILLALYTFWHDGERIAGGLRRLMATLFPGNGERLLDHMGLVVRATVFGLVGTALIQGAVAAVGFLIFGVPYPLALGALTAVLSFVPGGPVLVWGSGTIWLVSQGSNGAAIGNAIYGLFIVGSIDNVLRPILIRRSGSVEIPFLLIFFGVLGGLAAFGLLGLFVGPVLLSLAFALVSELPETSTDST